MLDSLGNLMEDASDFSWDSAKAVHAIILRNMEADRVTWSKMDKRTQGLCQETFQWCSIFCHTYFCQKIQKCWQKKMV